MQSVIMYKAGKKEVLSYKDCPKIFMGLTDIASLLMRPCDGTPAEIPCGYDGDHFGYLIETEGVELPPYYVKVFSCHNWLKVYDDIRCVAEFWGDIIDVFLAGGTFAVKITRKNAQ